MTKIKYNEKKEVFDSKVEVLSGDHHCEKTGHGCRHQQDFKRGLRLSLFKTLLTVAAALLFGSAVIIICCKFYQVYYLFFYLSIYF